MARLNLEELARKSMGDSVSDPDTGIQEIPSSQIAPNDKNFYEKSDLEELAASIELTGLLHPIIVKPDENGGYTIIDGERRFRAMADVLGRENVPAIVRRPVNSVIEELMLIEANRQQRKMSAGDLSKQAERYTDLLAQLKASGIEIPGRLRAAVAEAMQVSESKLARLHKIRTGLIPALLEKFDSGEMGESVAYAFAQLEAEEQTTVYGDGELLMAEYTVRDLARRLRWFEDTDCGLSTGSKCDHVETRMERCRKVNIWERCDTPCCRLCQSRFACKDACPHIAGEIAVESAERKAEQKRRNAEEKAEEDRRKKTIAAEWDRVRGLCAAAGVDTEDAAVKNAIGMDLAYYFNSKSPQCAPNYVMWLGHAVNLADLLGVTLDELAGRETGVQIGHEPGIEWHKTEIDGPPEPDYLRTLIVCGDDGCIRTVPVGQLEQTFSLMDDWCVWWAWVSGPADE